MNTWGSAERFLAMVDTRIVDREALVAEIANALAVRSEYVVRINLEQTQRAVDFSWAARQAGRRLGVRVNVTSHPIKADDHMQMHVTAIEPLS